MNKKLIIGIVAGVIALAVIIVAIIGITNGFGAKNPADSSSDTGISSDASSGSSSNSSITGNETVVSDFTVSSDGTAVVEAEKPDSNTIIEVPITVSNNSGFMAGQFVFSYDKSALTYLDYAKGDLFDEYEVNAADGKINCLINSADLKDIKGDGKLIVLKFKAKDGAKAGSYSIKVESSTAGTVNEKIVTPTVNGGTITIK